MSKKHNCNSEEMCMYSKWWTLWLYMINTMVLLKFPLFYFISKFIFFLVWCSPSYIHNDVRNRYHVVQSPFVFIPYSPSYPVSRCAVFSLPPALQRSSALVLEKRRRKASLSWAMWPKIKWPSKWVRRCSQACVCSVCALKFTQQIMIGMIGR